MGLTLQQFKDKVRAGDGYKGKQGALKAIHRFSQWTEADRVEARSYVEAVSEDGPVSPSEPKKASKKVEGGEKIPRRGKKEAAVEAPAEAAPKRRRRKAAGSSVESAEVVGFLSSIGIPQGLLTRFEIAEKHLHILTGVTDIADRIGTESLKEAISNSAQQCVEGLNPYTKAAVPGNGGVAFAAPASVLIQETLPPTVDTLGPIQV